MAYAENTTVDAGKTKGEIERLVTSKHKCESFQIGSDFANRTAVVQFKAHQRYVRFIVKLPDREDKKFRDTKGTREYNWTLLKTDHPKVTERIQQEERRIWRALLLVIKAKLEAVDSGISEFEEEFMAHIVMPNDKTIGELLTPVINAAYDSGMMPKLLEAPKP